MAVVVCCGLGGAIFVTRYFCRKDPTEINQKSTILENKHKLGKYKFPLPVIHASSGEFILWFIEISLHSHD